MPDAKPPFPVIDADTQVIEPGAIWSEYLEPEYRVPARSAFWHDAGEVSPFTVVNGKQVRETTTSRIPREAIWRPGMTLDDIGDLDPMAPHEINPGAQEPKARLRDMDAMGVAAAVLFPYYFGEYFPLVENPDVAAALARAYNNWIFDFARTDPRRLVPAAVLPIQNINFALAELRRVEKIGFKTVVMRPVFVCDRYLNHPYFDPLWAELGRLGVTAAIRAAAGSSNPEWSAHGPFIERVSAGFGIGHPAASTIAPMMDNMSALLVLLAHAHLTRFEGLKLVLTNSKASWLPLVLEKSEGYLTIAAAASIPVRVDSDKVFFEQEAMIQFDADELGVQRMYDTFENAAVWGSHYPAQNTTPAALALEQLSSGGVPDAAIRKMMSDNAARTYHISLAAAR